MATMASGPVIGAAVTPIATTLAIASSTQADVAPLPAGLPHQLVGQLAWTGSDFDESDWVVVLSEEDLKEVDGAVAHFKGMAPPRLLRRMRAPVSSRTPTRLTPGAGLELGGECVSRDNFPLPTVGTKLDKASHDIHNGRGFGLIRGVKPGRFSVEDMTLVYLGVSAYIADQRGRQDSKGNMLGTLYRAATQRRGTANGTPQFTLWPTAARRRAGNTTATRPSPS